MAQFDNEAADKLMKKLQRLATLGKLTWNSTMTRLGIGYESSWIAGERFLFEHRSAPGGGRWIARKTRSDPRYMVVGRTTLEP